MPAEAEAVYLLYEQSLNCTSKGLLVRSGRQAIKVLRSDGVGKARVLVKANTFNTRVRKMNGWVLNPDSSKQSLDIKSAISTSLGPDTLYWDVKTLILYLPEVLHNSLVGFEWEEEVKPISLEDVFVFQHPFPVLEANYNLTALPDYQPVFEWVNWPAVQPVISGAKSLISIKDIPAIKDEPLRPSNWAVAGRLIARLKSGSQPRYGKLFSDWKDMGEWYEQLSRERRLPEDSIKAKAQELISGLDDSRKRIERLAEFVQQNVRYVSIQIGIGGYQPHPAAEILAKCYGDCKDKATLLAALLQSIGIDSYYLIVNTERQVIMPSSPVSLFSFNHVVLAIKVPEDTLFSDAEAVFYDPEPGWLLIFDPTTPYTPVGQLPFYLRGNCGLLVAGESSRLMELPGSSPEKHGIVRKGKFVLSADGLLKGQVIETLSGFQAEAVRMRLRDLSENERRRDLENFLARSLSSFVLESYEYLNLDNPAENLQVDYAFSAGSYLSKAGSLFSFKPGILAMVEDYEILKQKEPRTYPLLLSSVVYARDEFEIALPEKYTLEASPDPVELDSDFADYSCVFELKGDTLYIERQLRIKKDFLPAGRFDEARKFFRMLSSEERRRLLLKEANQEEDR